MIDKALRDIVLNKLHAANSNSLSGEELTACFFEHNGPIDGYEHMQRGKQLNTLRPLKAVIDYLRDLGLIEASQEVGAIPSVKLTTRGMDFLEEDGGLSATLNAVTVKFDADNIRDLIEQGLLKSNLPEEKRHTIREALRSLPGSTLQAITTKLIEKALDDPTGALKIIAATIGIKL